MLDPEAPFLTAETDANGFLCVAAGGRWSLHGSLPSLPDLAARLERSPAGVRLDVSRLRAWDSSLVSLVTALARQCRARGLPFHGDELPQGMQSLLQMALSVPEENTPPAPERRLFFTRLGQAGITLGASVLEVFTFLGLTARSLVKLLRGQKLFRWNEAWEIIQRCGAEALPIVTLINFLIGVILGFVGAIQLEKFGATVYMATLVGIAMARELGCLMTGIIMSGRTGAAFAAELGSMKVSQEIDALRTLGISPFDHLVLPRLLAMVLMMPLLTAYGNVMGMLGGAALAPSFGVTLTQYYHQLVASLDLPNYLAGIIKSAFFGAIVAGAGCLKGIQSGSSAAAVGSSTTSAVVTSITAIIALDAVFAFVLSLLGI